MTTFFLGWRATSGAGAALLQPRLDPPPPCVVTTVSSVSIHIGLDEFALVTVYLNPTLLNVNAIICRGALHYWRLADGTVKPLLSDTPNMRFEPGDAYVAVTPDGARLAETQPGGASAAVARFIHLRDYFNADRLAEALLAHLVELGEGAEAAGAGVLVVEAR